MQIEIFRMSNAYLDGGSRDEITTNRGMFSLIKKLKNPNDRNGFYKNGKKVEENLEKELVKAMDIFLKLKEYEYVLREVANFNNLYNKHGYKAVKIE